MPKPTQTVAWATDANYTGGAEAGTPTKVEPTPAKKAEGWEPAEEPPAQTLNWWMNLLGVWITWLNTLAGNGTGNQLVQIDDDGDLFNSNTVAPHVTFSGGITSEVYHGDVTRTYAPTNAVVIGGGSISAGLHPDTGSTPGAITYVIGGSGTVAWFPLETPEPGRRVKVITIYADSIGAPAFALSYNRAVDVLGDWTNVPTSIATTNTGAVVEPAGDRRLVMTLDTPHVVASGDKLWVKVTNGAQDTNFSAYAVTYDYPAP